MALTKGHEADQTQAEPRHQAEQSQCDEGRDGSGLTQTARLWRLRQPSACQRTRRSTQRHGGEHQPQADGIRLHQNLTPDQRRDACRAEKAIPESWHEDGDDRRLSEQGINAQRGKAQARGGSGKQDQATALKAIGQQADKHTGFGQRHRQSCQ